ncbi:MAG: methylated-DNA--[protein]-cysteine S-methyltransferase [Fibrobacteria bacterium]
MKTMATSIQYALKTKFGSIYLLASENGLRGVYWQKQELPLVGDFGGKDPKFVVLRNAARQIGEYLKGKRREFDLELDFSGTPFQESVWKALRDIPFGETISYKQLATKIRNPKAVRAVGSANGKNPLCIIIPCHRVIASDGSIGGYAGGIPNKKNLLALEKRR